MTTRAIVHPLHLARRAALAHSLAARLAAAPAPAERPSGRPARRPTRRPAGRTICRPTGCAEVPAHRSTPLELAGLAGLLALFMAVAILI